MERVYGPYKERNGTYRIVVAARSGRAAARRTYIFATEGEAQAADKQLRADVTEYTVQRMLDTFLDDRAANETKPGSLETLRIRLEGMLKPVLLQPVQQLKAPRAQALYDKYREGRAPDTHHGALANCKAAFEWARKRKIVQFSPWDDIDPVGKKRRRKNQLRIDEARKLSAWLVARADTDDKALGVLVALVLGLRAHEVVGIERRDLDDNGTVLHVAKSKTAAGERTVILPEVLRAPLLRRAELRSGRLLPYARGWVRDNTKRACKAAGVPVVCAQALRGTNATFAMEAGMAPEAVARSLGHTSASVTKAAYALPGAGRSAELHLISNRLGTNPAQSVPKLDPPVENAS